MGSLNYFGKEGDLFRRDITQYLTHTELTLLYIKPSVDAPLRTRLERLVSTKRVPDLVI